jgi:hypothetical protein
MKRLLLICGLLLALCTTTFAARQTRTPMMLGFLTPAPASTTSVLAISSAAGAGGWGTGFSQTGLAYSFVSATSCQASKFKAYASVENGTVVAADLVADFYSDASGVPNASIESKIASADQAGASWIEFTGFTATSTFTAGTQYWIVLRNANASPTVNFPTYRWGSSGGGPALVNSNGHATWGNNKAASTDGGVTWTGAAIGIIGWRIECSDGTFIGVPVSTIAVAGTGDYVYGTREFGDKFTTPANATSNVIGVMMPMAKIGTPAQNLYYRLYAGSSSTPTLLASTADIPIANISTSSLWAVAYFATPQVITGSTVLRVVAGHHGAGGDTSNAYRTYVYTIDNTAGSKALLCYAAAGCAKTLTTDGITFTDTDTETTAFGLLLDTTGEFTPTVASGGVIGG